MLPTNASQSLSISTSESLRKGSTFASMPSALASLAMRAAYSSGRHVSRIINLQSLISPAK